MFFFLFCAKFAVIRSLYYFLLNTKILVVISLTSTNFFLLVKIFKINVSKYSFPSLKESNRKLDTVRDNVT